MYVHSSSLLNSAKNSASPGRKKQPVSQLCLCHSVVDDGGGVGREVCGNGVGGGRAGGGGEQHNPKIENLG
jgi:hypothetical protein